MKKFTVYFILLCFLVFLVGCGEVEDTQILATTKPLYQFASILCEATPLKVDLLVAENISCLHDYTLQVSQMRKLESAELIILNGAGFEDFLIDALPNEGNTVDCSTGIELHCHTHEHHDEHNHDNDPHIWLSIDNAQKMAENIYSGLCQMYPQYTEVFNQNMNTLRSKFVSLKNQASSLEDVSCRELITFHDGFSYMAESFDLHILKAIEEESGSEASAQELIEIINDIETHNLPAIFTEVSGATSASTIIQSETGVHVFALDMALSERNYFEAMEHNIKILKEALE